MVAPKIVLTKTIPSVLYANPDMFVPYGPRDWPLCLDTHTNIHTYLQTKIYFKCLFNALQKKEDFFFLDNLCGLVVCTSC